MGSSPSYQGVCGRHGGEEAWVTQGGLVSSERKVWLRSCDTHRRKGEQQGTQTSTYSPREVGADISASEIPADAVPGVGSGNSTQERGQSKRPWIAALEQRRWCTQNVHWRGKASYFVESEGYQEIASRHWEVG